MLSGRNTRQPVMDVLAGLPPSFFWPLRRQWNTFQEMRTIIRGSEARAKNLAAVMLH